MLCKKESLACLVEHRVRVANAVRDPKLNQISLGRSSALYPAVSAVHTASYLCRDVMISKTHGTIIPWYQVHSTVFIAVFLKKANQDLHIIIILIVFGREAH